ncbi:polysaccharide lyase family 7 protein [Flindersiella endophytica]
MATIRGFALVAAGAVLVGAVAYVPLSARGQATAAADCDYPAQVLDLRGWKLQLPIGEEEHPDEITQPQLASYKVDPWFLPTQECDGVRLRSAVNGVTTGGSSYPRSELREMTSDGSDEAAWSSTDGTHTMTIEQTVTHLPNEKQHLVVGQIHGGDDDVSVFRVEGNSLYVTNGDDPHYRLVTDNFALNQRFQVKFTVSGGTIHAFYNGKEVASLDVDVSTAYFKAGAYTQANCENSSPCDESNYGETVIHKLTLGADDSGKPGRPSPGDPGDPGPGEPKPDPQDPAPGKALPVSEVSASGDDGNVPSNTLDESVSTRWSDEGDGVWVRYDLGARRTIGAVGLSWYKGDRRTADFRIETSSDGERWTTKYTGTSGGKSLRPETYDIPDTAARYVRVVGFGNTENEWTSITKAVVLGAS